MGISSSSNGWVCLKMGYLKNIPKIPWLIITFSVFFRQKVAILRYPPLGSNPLGPRAPASNALSLDAVPGQSCALIFLMWSADWPMKMVGFETARFLASKKWTWRKQKSNHVPSALPASLRLLRILERLGGCRDRTQLDMKLSWMPCRRLQRNDGHWKRWKSYWKSHLFEPTGVPGRSCSNLCRWWVTGTQRTKNGLQPWQKLLQLLQKPGERVDQSHRLGSRWSWWTTIFINIQNQYIYMYIIKVFESSKFDESFP